MLATLQHRQERGYAHGHNLTTGTRTRANLTHSTYRRQTGRPLRSHFPQPRRPDHRSIDGMVSPTQDPGTAWHPRNLSLLLAALLHLLDRARRSLERAPRTT